MPFTFLRLTYFKTLHGNFGGYLSLPLYAATLRLQVPCLTIGVNTRKIVFHSEPSICRKRY